MPDALARTGGAALSSSAMYAARLRENWPRVAERVESARQRAGQNEAVTIVAVTKTHPPEAARAAFDAGLRVCGENRVQELEEKVAALAAVPIEWHLIGHLQRNKVKAVLPLATLIHSVDSERLAREISAVAVKLNTTADVLVQLNVSGEETKGGFEGQSAVEAVGSVASLPGLRVRGIMTMAPFTDDETTLRATFRAARSAFDACAAEIPAFEARHLSMGMSNDFEIAIEEGATMVRLGTVLFGERHQ